MNRNLVSTLFLVCGQAVAAGTAASVLGKADPWVWIIGGFGAAVVYVKNPPISRPEALINSLISVMIGGLIAPPIAIYCASHYDQSLASPYPFAFVLSSFWPWVLPVVVKRVQALLGIAGKNDPPDEDGKPKGKKPGPPPVERRRQPRARIRDFEPTRPIPGIGQKEDA